MNIAAFHPRSPRGDKFSEAEMFPGGQKRTPDQLKIGLLRK
jgi:hypothetical protein